MALSFIQPLFTGTALHGIFYLHFDMHIHVFPICESVNFQECTLFTEFALFLFFVIFQINIIIPISHLILCSVVLLMCIYQEPYKLGRGLLIVAAGVPVYFLGVKWKSKPKAFQNFMSMYSFYDSWFKIQLACLYVVSGLVNRKCIDLLLKCLASGFVSMYELLYSNVDYDFDRTIP